MTPHIQRIKHRPSEGQYGDCYRTAIACLLDMEPEEVPHFYGKDMKEQDILASEWLLSQGYNIFTISFSGELTLDDLLYSVAFNNPNIYYLVTAASSVTNHVFIAFNDKIVHDPSGRNETPSGPCDDNYYWIQVLVPLQICALAANPIS